MRVMDSEEMTDINIKGALFGIAAALAEDRDRYGTQVARCYKRFLDLAGVNLPLQSARRAYEPLPVRARSAIRISCLVPRRDDCRSSGHPSLSRFLRHIRRAGRRRYDARSFLFSLLLFVDLHVFAK